MYYETIGDMILDNRVDDNKPEEPRCLIDTCKTTNTLIVDIIRYIETLQRMIG